MTNPIDLLSKTELKTELGAAMLELAEKDALIEKQAAEIERLREALQSLFRVCANLPLDEMDRMENEIIEASNVLAKG